MATAPLFRNVALVALLVLAPCLVRDAQAQSIRVGASVSQPTGSVALHNDSAIAAPTNDIQRVRISGVGGLDVRTAPGAVVRATPTAQPANRPTALRIVVEFVGN
jgi:hypothetical protein